MHLTLSCQGCKLAGQRLGNITQAMFRGQTDLEKYSGKYAQIPNVTLQVYMQQL